MRAGRIASVILVLTATGTATAVHALGPWGANAASSGSRHWLFALAVGLVLAAFLIPLGFMLDRALLRFRSHVEMLSSESIEKPGGGHPCDGGAVDIMLRPMLDALTAAIDQCRRREQALRAQIGEMEIRHRVSDVQRRQTRAVLNSLRDAVLVSDAFDELVLANPAAAQTLGFDPQVCGRTDHPPLTEIVKDQRLGELIRDVRTSAEFTNARRVELQIGPAARLYEASLICVENHKHDVGGVVTILHDLTREREISQLKSDFVSKASHELRTPLSSIRAYVEMLVDGEAADESARQEFYRIIQGETDRLGRLIDNMLNISRIEAGIVPIHREIVNVDALVARALHTMGPAAAEKSIKLSAAPFAASGPPTGESRQQRVNNENSLCVEGDADMLYQVVLNLVSNAVKYTPEGGRVVVSADAEGMGVVRAETDLAGRNGPSVVVSVADTGMGIPPEAMPRMFDKFFRIENYKRMAKGTGLGLSLCKHIVETVHHGQIGVESKLGMGSKFWFSIPMKYAGKKAA